MIAVQDFNVDSRICHLSGDLAELAWPRLVEALNQDISHRQYANVRSFKGSARCLSICKKKVGDALSIGNPCSSPFDAHSGASQRFAHFGQSAGTVLQLNG